MTVDEAIKDPWLKDFHDPTSLVDHKPEKFDFEDVELSRQQLRELIVDEVLHYNPSFQTIYPKNSNNGTLIERL